MIKNYFEDLLRSPAGIYSRKSFVILITFLVTMFLAIYISISDIILDKEITSKAVDVFDSLLIFLATVLGLATADTKINDKKTIEEKE